MKIKPLSLEETKVLKNKVNFIIDSFSTYQKNFSELLEKLYAEYSSTKHWFPIKKNVFFSWFGGRPLTVDHRIFGTVQYYTGCPLIWLRENKLKRELSTEEKEIISNVYVLADDLTCTYICDKIHALKRYADSPVVLDESDIKFIETVDKLFHYCKVHINEI